MSHVRIITALFALSGAVCAQEEASFGATAQAAPAMQDDPAPEAALPRKAGIGSPVVAARSNAFRPVAILPSADGPRVAVPTQLDTPFAVPAEPFRPAAPLRSLSGGASWGHAPERVVLPSARAPQRMKAPRGAECEFRAEAPAPVGDPLEYYTI